MIHEGRCLSKRRNDTRRKGERSYLGDGQEEGEMIPGGEEKDYIWGGE